GQYIKIADEEEFCADLERAKRYCSEQNMTEKISVLKFDADKIPESAVIRFMKNGDKFTKFGGGTKSLGNFFTDRKIPVRIRKNLPLIAVDSDILAVCGVEISDKIKIDQGTKRVSYIICPIVY
ncbi:MAG: tRNA lysidine(34) synthetase TilS, partial [Candidatus Coproplasma sp.]